MEEQIEKQNCDENCKCKNNEKESKFLVDIGTEETIVLSKIIRISKCGIDTRQNFKTFGFSIFFEGNQNPCNCFLYRTMEQAKEERGKLLEKIENFYEINYNKKGE
jgi:hypothetical protein